jgi:hypothetical protein
MFLLGLVLGGAVGALAVVGALVVKPWRMVS